MATFVKGFYRIQCYLAMERKRDKERFNPTIKSGKTQHKKWIKYP